MVNFNKYTNYNKDSALDSIRFGSNAPLLEVELNELQEIIKNKADLILSNVLGDGISTKSNIKYENGILSINNTIALIKGQLIRLNGIGLSGLEEGDIYINATITDVDYNSTLRKYGYVDGEIIDNTIKDTRYTKETSKRKSLEYNIGPKDTSSQYTLKLGTLENGVFNITAPLIGSEKVNEVSDEINNVVNIIDTKVRNDCEFNTGSVDPSKVNSYEKIGTITYDPGIHYASVVAVGNYLYILGGGSNSTSDTTNRNNYKYDIDTLEYQVNKTIPSYFYYGKATTIDKNIYLFGGGTTPTQNNCKEIRVYDSLTDTYTLKTANTPFYVYGDMSSVDKMGKDIYVVDKTGKYMNKYDTLTDTYLATNITLPEYSYNNIVAVGSNIYLMGCDTSSSTATSDNRGTYCYDTITGTFSKMKDIPYSFKLHPCVSIENDIYLLGSNVANHYTYNYRYNTVTNSYTKNADIPNNIRKAVRVGNNIYILAHASNSSTETTIDVYKYIPPTILNLVVKCTGQSIYTTSTSYTENEPCLLYLSDDYTMYDADNNIIKSTCIVDEIGNTKMYLKQGAKLNGNAIDVTNEGWQEINILNYI